MASGIGTGRGGTEGGAVATVAGARAAMAGLIAAIPPFVIFWAFALAIVFVDLADGVLFLGDVDDRMRALEIRDLLADGAWFDRVLPVIAMPEAYVSPWSRLVDLPYIAIAKALAPLLGAEQGLAVAMAAWPPLMLAGFCAASVAVMRRVSGLALSPLHLAAAALAMTYALWEFVPGRIDHHNAQLALMMAMLAGFCVSGRRGGALAGIAAVLSVAVGLECLPFIAVAFGVCALAAVFGNEEARRQLSAAGLAMAVTAPLAGLALIGPQAMTGTECDAWSAPWIAATGLGGLVLAATGTRQFGERGPVGRVAVLGLGAGLLAGALALAFPACLAGPYAMIGPVEKAFWFDRVAQEESALSFITDRRYGLVAMLGLAGFVLVAALPRVVSSVRGGDQRAVMVWAVAATALALTLVKVRFVRFAPAFAALELPGLIAAFAAVPRRDEKIAAAIGAILPVIVAAGLFFATARRERVYDAVDFMTWDECEGADFSTLAQLAPGRIMAPPGLSFPIAEAQAGQPVSHPVAALSYHRASPGIRRVALAFTGNEAGARAAALAPFDYVAVCERRLPAELTGAPLYLALAAGRGWPGLVALGEPAERLPAVRFYRIDHAALR